jgi:hypothetical protein
MPVDRERVLCLSVKTAGCVALVFEMQRYRLFSGRQVCKRESSVDQIGIAQRRLSSVMLHGLRDLRGR